MAGETLSGPFLHKRGTTEKVAAYAGPSGEIVIDLGKNTIAVQNGTAGGVPLAREDRQLIAGAGLKVNDSNSATLASDITISVDANNMLAAADGLLYTDAQGKVASKFSLTYDEGTGKFTVIGQDGTTEVASVTVPSHVTGLTTAEMVVGPTIDGAAQTGTFLHFVYTLSDGTTREIFVNVTDLIDIYTAGNAGISISNNQVSAVVDTANGMQITNAGVAVDFGDTLRVDSYTPEGGTATAAGKLNVKLSADANNILTYHTNGIFAYVQVVSTAADNIITDQTGAYLKLAGENNGLQWDATNGLIMPLDCGVL